MRFPTVHQLSKEQNRIFNLPMDRSYLVTGPPGTGKTVMALYRAHQRISSGSEPVLLVYNKVLRWYAHESGENLSVEDDDVRTYHSWAYQWHRKTFGSRIPNLPGKSYQYDWVAILKALALNKPAKVSSLLIDEAQDLPPEFFQSLPFIAESFDVFADENQRITDTNSTLYQIQRASLIGEGNVHTLRKNYRNTRPIARLASSFYVGLQTGTPELPDTDGPMPRMINTTDLNEIVRRISTFEKTHSDYSIGVVTESSRMLKKLVNRLNGKTRRRVQYYLSAEKTPEDQFELSKPGVRVVTYKSAKGLEFDAVFLPELNEWTFDPDKLEDMKMRLYVLISRARKHLFLAWSGAKPGLLDLFRDDLLEWS